jgi:hypothetical protein
MNKESVRLTLRQVLLRYRFRTRGRTGVVKAIRGEHNTKPFVDESRQIGIEP